MRKRGRKQSATEDLLSLIVVCLLIGIGVYLAPVIIISAIVLFIFAACKAGSDDDDQNNRDRPAR